MARKTRLQRKIDEEYLNENLPIDVLPYSNCEHFPDDPTGEELAIMKLANQEAEKVRRAYGMSRRDFVRTGAAFTVCLWAINRVTGGKYGYFAYGGESGPNISDDPRWDACQLDNANVQLANAPGEFVFDVQSHHVTTDEKWRVTLPVHHAFICGLFGVGSQGNKSGGLAARSNVDLCQNVGRWAYIKDIYLDSSTTAGVLSPVPAAPDEQQPLPFDEADETAHLIHNLSGSERCVTHGYVMPNRGWAREQSVGYIPHPTGGQPISNTTLATVPHTGKPLFQDDELEWMEERAIKYRHYLRGWKAYTPYGDVPFSSGMAHDDDIGMATNAKIMELNQNYGVPAVFASHKGIWLPTFDDRRQACDDVPKAAIAYPDIRFVIYHSGGGNGGIYPTDLGQSDASVPTTDYRVRNHGLIKNLRVHSWDAQSHVPLGLAHGNSPNVYVDLGSVVPSGADAMSIFYGTLVKHIGAQRICWGTDALWGGSPQAGIVRTRDLQMTAPAKELFNLPHGLDGDRYDPRVNALSAAQYNSTYKAQLLANAASWPTAKWFDHHRQALENWPTDGKAHPERSIRNGILGRNAAAAYEHDADQAWGKISCDDLQRMREEYLMDTVLGKMAPSRSNEIYGPRTRRQLIATLNKDWAENGWRA